MSQPLPPVTDLGNALLSAVPAQLATGVLTSADGAEYGIITVRTTSATVTAYLSPGEVREWADHLNGLHAQLGASSLIVPGPGALNGLRFPPGP